MKNIVNVNTSEFTILKTNLGSIKNSCTKKCAMKRPFIMCECARIEGENLPYVCNPFAVFPTEHIGKIIRHQFGECIA